jgi:hypothetical protein
MEISGTELICPLCRAPFDVLKKLGLLLLRTRCFRAFKISFVPKNPSYPKNSCFFNKEIATRDVHLFANSRKMRCFALFLRIFAEQNTIPIYDLYCAVKFIWDLIFLTKKFF